MENTKVDIVLDCCSDVFFKYTLSRKDKDSVYACNIIIERVTGVKVKESTVQNSNLDPRTIGKKRIILDVHMKDEKGRLSNLEMQTTYVGVAEMMRFKFCGARVSNNQLDSGEKHRDLKPVYQIILVEKCAWDSKNSANHYRTRNGQGEDESKYPLTRRTYIYLPVINEIAKKKVIQQMDDFEQLCFLFKNNVKNDTLESRERLVKVFMNEYEEMQKDDKLWSTATTIRMGEARYRYGLEGSSEEGIEEGIIRGKAEGKLEGERQFLHRLMEAKFRESCTTWLQSLTGDQLHIVSNLLLECDTLEGLKNRIRAILNNTSK